MTPTLEAAFSDDDNTAYAYALRSSEAYVTTIAFEFAEDCKAFLYYYYLRCLLRSYMFWKW